MSQSTVVQPEATISIHEVGDTTGKLWSGTFKTLRYLTHRQRLNRDRLTREYLGGESPQYSAEIGRASALAAMRIYLTEVPDWFKENNYGLDLADENILIQLYDKIQDVEKAHKAEHAKVVADAKAQIKDAASTPST